MLTLKKSMEQAGKCHLNWLDSEFNYLPSNCYNVAHDTGRWWDAMLRLEQATGFVIPAKIEGAMLQNLKMLADNPDNLLMVTNEVAAKFPGCQKKLTEGERLDRDMKGLPTTQVNPRLIPHDFREGMLAFNALVRYRDNKWARMAGHRMLETIDKILQADGSLDLSKLHCWGEIPHGGKLPGICPATSEKTKNIGRCLEAIVWFHEATGDGLALEVAEQIAQYHLTHTVIPDGSMRKGIVDGVLFEHTHSYLGTLRGLLLFGLLTKQHKYIDAVAATYRNALPSYVITESGYCTHDLGVGWAMDRFGDRTAETSSCGDVVQLGLWLALEAGYTEFLDDVERWVRSRLLPAQCTEADRPDLLKAVMRSHNINEEAAKATLWNKICIGGWTVYDYAHGGKGCTPDICSAVLHTLTDVYNNISTRTDAGLVINLHFDYEDDTVSIVSQRGEQAQLTVRPRINGNTLIRIPGWVARESVELQVNGKHIHPNFVGHFVSVPQNMSAQEITVCYAVPTRQTTEVTQKGSHNISWQGDEIIGVSPNDITPEALRFAWHIINVELPFHTTLKNPESEK